ncbi:MAG: Uma2 family endonuclease [Bryobacteraceae bacterium]
MPVAISQQELGAPPSVMRKKSWTRKECEALEKMGVFEGQRYELIEGELIDKMGMSPAHAVFLVFIASWLNPVFGDLRVRPQLPIDVGPEDNPRSEPQPDVCVTSQPAQRFSSRHPGPDDILLLVEVADTTLAFDTTTKAGLYARAGIADYWVLDVSKRRIIVHRSPQSGAYKSLTVYDANEPVSPLAAPEASLRISEFGV